MGLETFIASIESEWEPGEGFFWKIRQGEYRRPEYERAFAKVAAVPGLSTPPVPPRLVSLLWYIPLFMHWQVARINDNGGDLSHYSVAITAMTAEVERILGVP